MAALYSILQTLLSTYYTIVWKGATLCAIWRFSASERKFFGQRIAKKTYELARSPPSVGFGKRLLAKKRIPLVATYMQLRLTMPMAVMAALA